MAGAAPLGPIDAAAIVESVGDDLVVFHPRTEKLVVLNASAATVVRLIDGRRTTDDIVDHVAARFGWRRRAAVEQTHAVIASLIREGLITASRFETVLAERPYSAHDVSWAGETRLSLLGSGFVIRSTSRVVVETLRRMYQWFVVESPAKESDVVLGIIAHPDRDDCLDLISDRPAIDRAELEVEAVTEEEVIHKSAVIIHYLAVHQSSENAVHAGAVSLAGSVIAFPAVRAGGKSTLTAAAVLAGFDFVTDDGLIMKWSDPGAVVPHPRPLWLTEWSLSALGIDGGEVVWDPSRFTKAMVRIQDIGGAVADGSLRLSDVVRIKRASGPPVLTRISGGEVVSLLAGNGLNRHTDAARRFRYCIEVARTMEGWELRCDDPLEAGRMLYDFFASR